MSRTTDRDPAARADLALDIYDTSDDAGDLSGHQVVEICQRHWGRDRPELHTATTGSRLAAALGVEAEYEVLLPE